MAGIYAPTIVEEQSSQTQIAQPTGVSVPDVSVIARQVNLLAEQFGKGTGEVVQDLGGELTHTNGTVAPAEPSDSLIYSNQKAIRNKPLSNELVSSMSFLADMGIKMDVFSGGQEAKGAVDAKRTGSTRHDHGNAADVFFLKDGRRLDWNNPKDVPIFQEIVRRAKAAGLTGFGAGPGYMQQGSMHIGFGTPSVWGAGGEGANAPSWLREAYNSTTQQVAARNAAPQAVSSDPTTAVISPAASYPAPVPMVGTARVSNRVVDQSIPKSGQALLNVISMYESAGDYNVIVGKGKAIPGTTGSFESYAEHPRVIGMRTSAGPSTAAGRYQITATTWDGLRAKYPDLTDFSPINQDRAAWRLAQSDYTSRTGRDLLTDLDTGQTQFIGKALTPTWAGLAGQNIKGNLASLLGGQ